VSRKSPELELVDLKALWGRIQDAFGGVNPAQIAEKIGVTRHSVYKWRDAKNPPELENLVRISMLTSRSLDWLILGRMGSADSEDFIPVYFEEGVEKIIADLSRDENVNPSEMARDLATEALAMRGLVRTRSYDRLNYINLGERDQKFITIKLLGEIAAGKPIRAFEQFEEVQVPEEYIKKGRETYALRVRGDSMINEGILDGDLLICVESKDVFQGETVVALIDSEEATVKRFYKRGNQVRLEPANPEFEPIVLRADRVQIQGVVIGIYRRK
jgi:repressor LexA